MKECRVSVITPCFNSEKTIAKTIESVLHQTRPVEEYIIIDGASTDGTLDIIKSYEAAFEGRMKVYSEPDTGIYNAMNKGIRKTSGELIGIVNSDDYYEETAIENILKKYDGYEYSVIYGMLRMLKGGKELSVYLKNADFLSEDMIAHPSCFATKKIYEDLGYFDESYRYSADYEFMLRIKEQEKVRFIETYDIISNFSVDGASGSAKAYLETITLLHKKGFMSDKSYRIKVFKTKLALLLHR